MSFLINYMPPRITRKSYRPRASDRTMVDRIRPRSLSCFRIRMRRHDNEMNLQTDKRPGGSQHDMGWRVRRTSSLLPVAGEVFLLTLPFIERACRERSIGGEKPTYRYPISTKLNNSKIDDSESASPVILDTPAQTKLF